MRLTVILFDVTFVLTTILLFTIKFAEGAPYEHPQTHDDQDRRSLSKFDQRDLFENDADVLKLLRRLLDDSSLNERKRTYPKDGVTFDEHKRTYEHEDAGRDLDEYVRSMFRARESQNSNQRHASFSENSDEDLTPSGHGNSHGSDSFSNGNGGNYQGGTNSGSYNTNNNPSSRVVSNQRSESYRHNK